MGAYPLDVWIQIFITTYVLKFVVAVFAAPYAYAAKRITPLDERSENNAG